MLRVVILQHRLLHYRVRLFELLRARLASLGIELLLVHGQASETERARRDEGVLDWAIQVRNRYFSVRGKDFLWQPASAKVRAADLIILLQESRILSNYRFQLFPLFRGPLIAFWGHGRNYQAKARSGFSELWKALWMRHVDWWFAYTSGSACFLKESGFQKEMITVLDNAIDVSSFSEDIASILPSEILIARRQLGIDARSEVAIYCGSIYFEKRIDTLLRAADILRESLVDFHLLVVVYQRGAGDEHQHQPVGADHL